VTYLDKCRNPDFLNRLYFPVVDASAWLAPLTYLPVLPGWPAAWGIWRFQVLAIVPILSLVAPVVPPELGKRWLQRHFEERYHGLR
jgi:hypothetical protein